MNKQISFFSTAFTGGAGIAAKRLYDGLQGYEATFNFYHAGNFKPPLAAGLTKWTQKIKTSLYYRTIEQKLANRPTGLELFSPATLQYATPIPAQELIATKKTLIQLHWINGMLDIPSFFASIPAHIPIVWTLHDFNTFTGGCHYPSTCRKFETTCKNCEQLGIPSKAMYAFENQQDKANALKNKNLHIVTPSHWLQTKAEKSSVLRHARSFQTISNGLDMQEFKPLDKQLCRQVLEIPLTNFVLAFGAEKLDTTRKGLHYLWEALQLLSKQHIPITLLLFGKNYFIPQDISHAVHVCYVGEVNKGILQRMLYSAADAFILPSLEDNQPLTCLESMSCGTPVIGFREGGLPEMVIHEQTGLLATLGSSEELASAIRYLYTNPMRSKQLGEQARTFALQNFDSNQQAQRYWELYEKLLN